LVNDRRTPWTGVRNFQARNFLRAMRPGDPVLFYHSGDARQVVGIARVSRGPYPDPTATEGDWTAVDLAPVRPLGSPVTLAQLKGDPAFEDLLLVRQSRLSVLPVSPAQYQRILELAGSRAV
jgi:predicted RNA-binding protein with PUA-like domain